MGFHIRLGGDHLQIEQYNVDQLEGYDVLIDGSIGVDVITCSTVQSLVRRPQYGPDGVQYD